ncbi:MAG TPA: hypothetical protein VH189_08030 [Rhizomicrobium sp.]|nr:hypothetical protein [Rhizomicrobium sp.]
MNFRIEFFRDAILVKASPFHKSKAEAIEAATAGMIAHHAQLAIIRDCDAGNVEVARIKR